MTTILFDTLEFADRAMKAGFSREQAEFQAREAAQAIESKVATKGEMNAVRDELVKEIKLLEHRMIIKFGAMLGVAIGILITILKFIM